MSKIAEKARELGELLVNSEEYLAKEKAESELEKDQEAVNLLNQFEVKQQQYSQNRDDKELLNELKQLRAEMLENETVKKYIQSQQNFNNLMNIVNRELSQMINPNQAGCAPGCASC